MSPALPLLLLLLLLLPLLLPTVRTNPLTTACLPPASRAAAAPCNTETSFTAGASAAACIAKRREALRARLDGGGSRSNEDREG